MRAGVVFQRFYPVQPPPIRLLRMTVLKRCLTKSRFGSVRVWKETVQNPALLLHQPFNRNFSFS